MTKQESQMLKGVAILLMLFYHLFNQLSNVELCHNYVYIDGLPLAYILSRAAHPVSFFLILGGYGLYKVNESGDRHRWSRVLKLFIHYWITLIIFLTIGHFMWPSKYPGSISTVVANFTAFHSTYNGEMWFLFPYIVLSLLAPGIFKIMKAFKVWQVVIGTLFILLCTSYCISRFGKYLYSNYWIYNPLLVLHLLFSFSLGAMAARSGFFERVKAMTIKYNTRMIKWAAIIILIVLNCAFKYNFFYAFLIITLILSSPLPETISSILVKLGNQSMNMWMIHSWFCYHLFHDFIYSFSYPLLIFAVLTILSYGCSILVNIVAKPIELRLMSKTEVKAKPIL